MGLPQGIRALGELYARREATPTDVVTATLETVERLDPVLGAFRTTMPERALDEARALTRVLAGGRDATAEMPLFGVPVAVKELIDVAHVEITAGSRVLAGRIPSADAPIVSRLRAAGAIVVGTTRSHEFGWGITTQHDLLGGTRNPYDPARIPGGSSGGSAAAVGSGMVPVGLGTDTAGSLRVPASFCGAVGFRPTPVTLPSAGVLPLARSLDRVGALTLSPEDARRVHAVIAGAPTRASADTPPEPVLAISEDLIPVALDAAQAVVWERVVAAAGEVGRVEEIELPGARQAGDVLAAIQAAEAYWWHTNVLGTFPSRAAEYGRDVRARLGDAAGVSLTDYLDAAEARRRLMRRFAEAFEHVDAILAPIAAAGPSSIETPDVTRHRGSDVPLRDVTIPFTAPHSLAGLPTCAIPAGISPEGLPVGVQVACARGRDERCLGIAAHVARAVGFSARL